MILKRGEKTNWACPWCKGGPITASENEYLSLNDGEGGDKVPRFMQVFEHPECKVRPKDRWTYHTRHANSQDVLDSKPESAREDGE